MLFEPIFYLSVLGAPLLFLYALAEFLRVKDRYTFAYLLLALIPGAMYLAGSGSSGGFLDVTFLLLPFLFIPYLIGRSLYRDTPMGKTGSGWAKFFLGASLLAFGLGTITFFFDVPRLMPILFVVGFIVTVVAYKKVSDDSTKSGQTSHGFRNLILLTILILLAAVAMIHIIF